jgi:nucleotide-binding universal stress UspA family protein
MKILIATDGTEFSHSAIEKACQIIAEPENTSVKVISPYTEVLPLDAFPQSAEYARKEEAALHKQAEEYAAEGAALIEKYFPNRGVTVTNQAIMGAPDEILIETAKEWNADIIVVGSHHRGFLERTFLGSISDSLVHHAPCSVFVVR